MSGFTKLVPEIVQSSIWNEDSDTRVVWITMLAVKDENGYVRGDSKTIARIANVHPEAAEKALQLFQQPDPSSHTPDNEGRRISPMPGGWLVLNHDVYRLKDDVIREQNRERVRRHRAKHGCNVTVTLRNVTGALPSASASASVSASASGGDSKGEDGTYQLPPAPPRDDGSDAEVPEVEPPVVGEVKKWLDEAFGAFPDAGPPTLPERQKVLSHVSELIAAGKSWEMFESVCYWVRRAPFEKAKFKPKDASQLTNPLNWTMWLSHMRETDHKFEEEKRRKRR